MRLDWKLATVAKPKTSDPVFVLVAHSNSSRTCVTIGAFYSTDDDWSAITLNYGQEFGVAVVAWAEIPDAARVLFTCPQPNQPGDGPPKGDEK